MGLLANFKIRTKVLVALLPLVLMVLVAALYASIQMSRIDTRYSELIGRDVKALHGLMNARVMDNRFHQLLYQEIAEPNLDKMRSIDGDLDKTAAEFYSSIDEAKRQSPNLTSRIKPAEDLFDQVVSESRPVRGAALTNDNAKALELMRKREDKEYSLTDCISMAAMRREKLTEALTNDHHFTQEGFEVLIAKDK